MPKSGVSEAAKIDVKVFPNHKTLQKLYDAYSGARQAEAVNGTAQAKSRMKALEAAIQATAEREGVPVPPNIFAPETSSEGLTENALPISENLASQDVDNQTVELTGQERQNAQAKIIGKNREVNRDNLSPAQANRLEQLVLKEDIEGLNEREYSTMEKLLAMQAGEKVAARVEAKDSKIPESEVEDNLKSSLREGDNSLGISEQEVFDATKEFLSKISTAKGLKVRIVNSLDLAQKFPEYAEAANSSRGLHVVSNEGSTVYLIADNIGSKQQAIRTAMHEVLAHHGLRAYLSPSELNRFLKLVEDRVDLSNIEDKYKNHPVVRNLDKKEQRLFYAEEYVASSLRS